MSPTNPSPGIVSQAPPLSTEAIAGTRIIMSMFAYLECVCMYTGISVGVILLLILTIVIGTTVIVILRIRKQQYKGIFLLINF